jgi:hypothetical protein
MSQRVTELRIDPDSATHEELVAEVRRLDEVCGRWAEAWKTIVHANAEAWQDQVAWRDELLGKLNEIIARRVSE